MMYLSVNYLFSCITNFFVVLIDHLCFLPPPPPSLFFLICVCNQRSLASYIKKYACSNAKTEDLWAALEEGSGEPVNKLMNSWTKQKGYPVVSVEIKDQTLVFEQVSCVCSLSAIFVLK